MMRQGVLARRASIASTPLAQSIGRETLRAGPQGEASPNVVEVFSEQPPRPAGRSESWMKIMQDFQAFLEQIK